MCRSGDTSVDELEEAFSQEIGITHDYTFDSPKKYPAFYYTSSV